jgi:single-strand DNA-binding protein
MNSARKGSAAERESWTLIADSVVTAKSARPPGRKAAKANDTARQHRAAARVQAPPEFDDALSF